MRSGTAIVKLGCVGLSVLGWLLRRKGPSKLRYGPASRTRWRVSYDFGGRQETRGPECGIQCSQHRRTLRYGLQRGRLLPGPGQEHFRNPEGSEVTHRGRDRQTADRPKVRADHIALGGHQPVGAALTEAVRSIADHLLLSSETQRIPNRRVSARTTYPCQPEMRIRARVPRRAMV